MPEAPESVVEGLRNIREGLHLRWNPRSRVREAGRYTAEGVALPPVYDARWELWDRDSEGAFYRVLTLQHRDGSFKPPGEWLLELVRAMDPARYGGSVNRMLKVLVDQHNDKLQEVTDEDFEELSSAVVEWSLDRRSTKVSVLADVR